MENQWKINGGTTGPAGPRVPPGLAKQSLLACCASNPLTSSPPPWGHRALAGALLGPGWDQWGLRPCFDMQKRVSACSNHVSACKDHDMACKIMFRHAKIMFRYVESMIWHAEVMFRHAEIMVRHADIMFWHAESRIGMQNRRFGM